MLRDIKRVMLLGKFNNILFHLSIYSFCYFGEEKKTNQAIFFHRYTCLRDCCLNCRQCNSGNDIMCRQRVMFPEGNNNGFAHGVVCKEK